MTEIIARLHIALADTDPRICRRVEAPVDANLKMLHDVIQGAMGWLDYHLWEFEVDDRRYGTLDPDWRDDSLFAARNTKLKVLLDRGIRQFVYTYDMGDNWEHVVTVEAVEDGHRHQIPAICRWRSSSASGRYWRNAGLRGFPRSHRRPRTPPA